MKFILGAAALMIVLAAIRASATILIPIVLALFLSLISFPLVRRLQEHGLHRVLAVMLTMLAVLGMLVGPTMLVITAIRQFAGAVPEYEARLREMLEAALEWLPIGNRDLTFVTGIVDPSQVFSVVVAALTSVVTIMSFAFLVVLVSAFMLVEAADVLGPRQDVLPPHVRQVVARIMKEMQTWLWVKTIISLLTGVAAAIWVWFLGIEFPLLWGLTAFLLNYIPNLGSVIAAVPPALLALIQISPITSLVVVLGYIAINAGFGSILEPFLMGRSVGLRPIVVLLSVLLWGWMWGIAGMLLAVPIMMAFKFGLETSDNLRWIADLLGDGREPARPPKESAAILTPRLTKAADDT